MKKYLPYILIIIALLIAGGIYLDKTKTRDTVSLTDKPEATSETSGQAAELKDLGPAPEFTGINNWLNSEPLTMEALRGKVVLIDFWTYSCINCVRTLPYVTSWYEKYKDDGFVIVGVHTPEFTVEKDTKNVERAIARHKITYPVAQDNDYKTWRAYSNRYWPAHYLVDQRGHIVYTHFGEGKYDVTENTIRKLLGLDETQMTNGPATKNQAQTPEIYFGLNRLEYLGGQRASNKPNVYVMPNRLDLHHFALEGNWQFDAEKATLVSGPGKIKLHFNAAKVHMVASSNKPISVTAKTDNQAPVVVQISESDLYTLFDSDTGGEHTIEISIPESGFEAFTFTFG